MHKGEEYEKLKQKAIQENFIYDIEEQKHDIEKLYLKVREAYILADLIETRFCISQKHFNDVSQWFYVNSDCVDGLSKVYHDLQNDIRRLRK